MKKLDLNKLLNGILVVYILTWVYYAIFNWDVFSIKLNTNAGFTVIGGYPFAFFSLFGLVILVLIKYFVQIRKLENEKRSREFHYQKSILEKDLEILKMKEVLFKMQTSEMSKNSSHINDLHAKLDQISEQLRLEKEELATGEDENKAGKKKKEEQGGASRNK
jgi:hypothetical protein